MKGGYSASSGEQVLVFWAYVGSQFPTLNHQGSGPFQPSVVRYAILFPTFYVMLRVVIPFVNSHSKPRPGASCACSTQITPLAHSCREQRNCRRGARAKEDLPSTISYLTQNRIFATTKQNPGG
jgi:hypothetical protein